MQILTIEQAIQVLEKIEFNMDGGIRLHPDSNQFDNALALIKDFVGYEAPLPILSKTRVQRGHTYGGEPTGMFYRIGKNDEGKTTIHLTGRYGNYKDVDIKFTEGDTAIYDSFNFDYLGAIERITDKTVTIKPQFGSKTHRLDLATFANRNHDFSLEKSHKRRMEWYD
jgi:hypothetical protein